MATVSNALGWIGANKNALLAGAGGLAVGGAVGALAASRSRKKSNRKKRKSTRSYSRKRPARARKGG